MADGKRTPRTRWRYVRGEGLEFDRVAFFTDAVFAIAMTLLIVSIGAPHLPPPTDDPGVLTEALKGLGPEFTPEVRDAWTTVYGVLAATMKAGVEERLAEAV